MVWLWFHASVLQVLREVAAGRPELGQELNAESRSDVMQGASCWVLQRAALCACADAGGSPVPACADSALLVRSSILPLAVHTSCFAACTKTGSLPAWEFATVF